jgi:hypothetical protein
MASFGFALGIRGRAARRDVRSQCESSSGLKRSSGVGLERRRGSLTRLIGSVLVGHGALLYGCAPSREALSAGEVGCRPSELSVHDVETSSGWAQDAQTWVAECRGRRFICSEVMTSSLDFGWLFWDRVDSRDSDVSCHEEIDSSASAPPKAQEPRRNPSSEPPKGGAGFELGVARDAVQKQCEASGHEWREGAPPHAFCSGTAAPIGFEASTQLTFCKDVLCGITISHVPKAAWATAFQDLDARLTDRYGPATTRQVRIPSVCRTNEQFDRCAIDGALDFEVRWQWSRGERLRLSLEKPSPQAATALRLMYVKLPGVARVDSSAL